MAKDTRLTRMFETNQQWHDRRTSEKRSAFERKIVRKLLDAGGFDRLQRKVMGYDWDGCDNEDYFMTFGWFLDAFPDFPFMLTISEESWVPRAVEIFNSSSRSCKLWNIWKEAKSTIPAETREERQLAVAIPCSQESGLSPALIIHNGALPDGPFENNVPNQIQVRMVEPRTDNLVFIQHLSYFSAQVGIKWQAI
jgi:hypothetical protein